MYQYQFSYVLISTNYSTNQGRNLLLLDEPAGRVKSQIISVVCQIQRFDFDCNLRGSDAKINNTDTPTFTFKT
jgi:hypothetical protein